AIAVGVAKILRQMRDEISGRVRLIFQPSEEAFPSGAHELVKADVMHGVDGIFAFHVDPVIEAGKIGLRKGLLTANANEFKVTIFGKSGHAARPHLAIDTIHVANQILTALYDTVAKRSQSHLPAVVTVGKVIGGTKSNVIPDRVDISGTIRSIDQRTNAELEHLIETRVAAITRSAEARYQIEFPSLIPSVKNDAGLIDLVRDVSTSALGEANIVDIANISMGGEDFSWFLNEAPGALVRLGARRIGDDVRYLHTDSFDIDETALVVGMQIMVLTVLEFLAT
ncbi:MAG: amidohydrolase, partial [bacterium]